jgi:hypothetical protein
MDYNFNTDEVKYSEFGLPVGKHKVMITAEEFKNNPEKPENPNMLVVTFQAVEGDFKGKTQIAYYNVNHSTPTTRAIARESVKLISDATGKPVSAQSPLKGRVLQIQIAPQPKNPDFNQITEYFTEDGTMRATKTKKGLVPVVDSNEIPN